MALRLGPTLIRRALAIFIALAAIPAALSITVLLMDQPVRVGEPAPRTIIAPDLIRVQDSDATARARRQAANDVEVVTVDDQEAKAAMVQTVRDAFAVVRDVREPDGSGSPAKRPEQVAALRDALPMLSPRGDRLLVQLTDDELTDVTAESVSVAQEFARQRISEEELDRVAEAQLPTEMVVRSFPNGVAGAVVEPIIRAALRPTVRVDDDATQQAREAASSDVATVIRTFTTGSPIVTARQPVDPVELAALRQKGLEGAEPWRPIAKALLVALMSTVAVCAYLRTYRGAVWRSSRRMLLFAILFLGFALTLEAIALLETNSASGWRYAVPIGAVVMLATILFDPPIGVLTILPATVLVAYTTPGETGPAAFALLAGLATVPLVTRLSSRRHLRRAAWQSTLLYTALAGLVCAVFGDLPTARVALLGGLANGLVTAMLVNSALPFLESSFKVVTATGLLDLADRNHPLLRELEQRALGSYNHSVLVSTMVERACRAISADALLGSVAALYHDIGKVRQPWFFVENQFGIANPHDELEPDVSALIIQEHVTDGIAMARSYRLPPEIVEGIATHHGTTIVSYFHRQAVEAAGPDGHVDERHYRYKGRKPASKEMAVLMLADCCEAASRAAAQHNRNLARDDLDTLVHMLVAERVDDGQLDESSLTFAELKVVEASFLETLTGVYHPRIAYPPPVAKPTKAPITAEVEPGPVVLPPAAVYGGDTGD